MIPFTNIDKSAKEVFLPPVKRYYLGKSVHGTPYFWPLNFCSSIFKIRKLIKYSQEEIDEFSKNYATRDKKFKNLPLARRSKDWILSLFNTYYWIQIGWPIYVYWHGLGWKDKYDSPRYEWSPAFYIFFFKWQFCIFWLSPDNNHDKYYEMILWWAKYSDKDINKAKETWGWVDYETKATTWNDKYLITNNINKK